MREESILDISFLTSSFGELEAAEHVTMARLLPLSKNLKIYISADAELSLMWGLGLIRGLPDRTITIESVSTETRKRNPHLWGVIQFANLMLEHEHLSRSFWKRLRNLFGKDIWDTGRPLRNGDEDQSFSFS